MKYVIVSGVSSLVFAHQFAQLKRQTSCVDVDAVYNK